MLTLPPKHNTILEAFACVFSKRIWLHTQILLMGAILASGQRTVTAILRIMGLSAGKHFQTVCSRTRSAAECPTYWFVEFPSGAQIWAVWSRREASRLLLGMLVATFSAWGPVVMGLDDTNVARSTQKHPEAPSTLGVLWVYSGCTLAIGRGMLVWTGVGMQTGWTLE